MLRRLKHNSGLATKGGIEVGAITPKTRPKWTKWNSKLQKQGQGLVEYALILVMIAIVIIVILTYIGQIVFINMYSKITSGMGGAGG
jgi:pilus assembly protein Flp/PilA